MFLKNGEIQDEDIYTRIESFAKFTRLYHGVKVSNASTKTMRHNKQWKLHVYGGIVQNYGIR
jgi:hypothetical protein